MNVAQYLFAEPANGPYLTVLAAGLAVLFLLGLAAWMVARRSSYAAVRRRARQFRAIAFWAAVPGALYVQVRYRHIEFVDLRIWLVVIGGVFAVRLGAWILGLRRLGTDKVDERQNRRRQSYFRRSRRRTPAKRRR